MIRAVPAEVGERGGSQNADSEGGACAADSLRGEGRKRHLDARIVEDEMVVGAGGDALGVEAGLDVGRGAEPGEAGIGGQGLECGVGGGEVPIAEDDGIVGGLRTARRRRRRPTI